MAYLKEKKRTLTNGEFAFLLSALSDALLVIHSLSIRHEGIGLGTILLTAGGGAMLTGYGAADARVNGATSDDIEMLGQALYEAYTGKRFGGQWRFPPDSVETVRGVLRRMLTSDPALRFDGVFDLLHAAAGLDIPQEPPEIYARDVRALRRANAAAAAAPALDPAPGAPYAAEQSDSDHADAHASDDTAKSIPRWVLPMLAGVLLLLVAALLIALINR